MLSRAPFCDAILDMQSRNRAAVTVRMRVESLFECFIVISRMLILPSSSFFLLFLRFLWSKLSCSPKQIMEINAEAIGSLSNLLSNRTFGWEHRRVYRRCEIRNCVPRALRLISIPCSCKSQKNAKFVAFRSKLGKNLTFCFHFFSLSTFWLHKLYTDNLYRVSLSIVHLGRP